jgi:hypothetical protein
MGHVARAFAILVGTIAAMAPAQGRVVAVFSTTQLAGMTKQLQSPPVFLMNAQMLVQRLKAAEASGLQPQPCPTYLVGSGYRCVLTRRSPAGGGWIAFPPLPSLAYLPVAQVSDAFESALFPTSMVRDGDASVARYKELEKGNTLFSCGDVVNLEDSHISNPDVCYEIVAQRNPNGPELLARCLTTRFGTSVGPPTDCEPVAFPLAGAYYVPAAYQLNVSGRGSGTEGEIVEYIHGTASMSAVVDKAVAAMKMPPLSFDLSGRFPLGFNAGATERQSSVIDGYRESVSVNAYLVQTPEVRLMVYYQVMTNKQNTPDGYASASQTQKNLYREALIKALHQTLPTACSGGTGNWTDENSLSCSKHP